MDIKTLGWATAILLVVTVIVGDVVLGPQEVTLSSKRWTCTSSRPVGIGAECTHYELKDLGVGR